MADSDIQVGSIGSRVRYVGSRRDVRGSEGMVLEVTSDGLVVVDFGSTVRFCHPDDLIHVRPPKPSSEIRSVGELELVHPKPPPNIEVGSTVRYVGRGVCGAAWHGSEGVVTKVLPPDRFWVSFGRFTMDYARGELELVRPPNGATPTTAKSDPSVLAEELRYEALYDGSAGGGKSSRLHELFVKLAHAGINTSAPKPSSEIRAADEVADHLDGVQCRCVALPAPVDSGPNIDVLGTDVTDEYPLLRGSGGPPGEAPPLNTLDLRAHHERVVHSRLEERLRAGNAVDAMASKIFSTMLRSASPVNTVWAGSWPGAAESGSGIAASPVNWKRQPTACSALGKPLPRPATRHQTTSWDPDMPLPDAEPGRYGWLP